MARSLKNSEKIKKIVKHEVSGKETTIFLEDSRVHKTTYAPMIYTASCVMFLMRADTLCGEVGGLGWRWRSQVLWAPLKWHDPIGKCWLGPKKLEI
jgi:hypothetical protein